ncbi:MAG: CoA ester lyase [Chitinophagales bacterium]|nr:CoA ester lyase [Hyphomicrobiales bacterium]
MTAIRPRRSVLSMPGSNARALEKATGLAADCLMFDLEDAVAPEAKDIARAQVAAAVQKGGFGRREILVRINSLSTPLGEADLTATAGAHGLVLPKVETAEDVDIARARLLARNAPGIALWLMIETPLAILNIKDIAAKASHPAYPIAAFVIGPNDIAKQTRIALTPDRLPMLAWISSCLLAARGFGVDMIDGVFNDFKDEPGFAADCALGRKLGMDGKHIIHPSQIGAANNAFAPSPDDVAQARKIIAAFELPENQGKGVIPLDGRMVELLHAEMARRTVAFADAIGE